MMRRTLLCAVMALLLVQAAQAQMPPPVFALCHENEDNLPWQIKDGKGLNMLLLELAAAKSGVKLEFTPLPWKRCLAEIEASKVAGGFSLSYSEDRAKFAMYPMASGKPDLSRRMRTDSYTLYRLKGSAVDWDGSKFSNLTGPVGAQWGYSVAADLKKRGVEVDELAITALINMRKLVAGRIQMIALLTSEGESLIAQPEFAGKVEAIAPPFVEKAYFVVFSRDFYANNKKAAEDYWSAVGRARDSAEFKALRQQLLLQLERK